MTNPFSGDQVELVNISSGVEVGRDVADRILHAEQLGEEQFSKFCQTNLFTDNPDIFSNIKKNKLRTFSSEKMTVKDSKGRQSIVKTNRNLFARLLVISKSREINLKELLSYCLSDYPLSIATVAGGLVKTTKAKMLHILEEAANNPVVDTVNIGENNALIVDVMAVIQAFKGKCRTFGEFADSIFDYLVKLTRQCKANRLDVVADRYPAISIKNSERSKRAAQGVQRIHILNKDQNIPKQWKKYLSSGENKESLIVFLCDHWSNYISSSLSHLECIYVTRKEKCLLFTCGSSQTDYVVAREVPQLECDHEEADTRLLLHYKAAADTHQRIIMKTPDTDVFILCIAMQQTVGKELLIMTGTGNKFRLIDISSVSNILGEELCACLPGFHAFTGIINRYYKMFATS